MSLVNGGGGGGDVLPPQPSGGGSITEITSDDDSVTITDPEGPITDLSVSGEGGSPFVDRTADYTLADHFSGIALDYFAGTLILEGDAAFAIL